MNTIIVITTSLFVIIGISVFVWSIYDTRKKYYQEYLNRRRNKK